jgi:hypothetical protein
MKILEPITEAPSCGRGWQAKYTAVYNAAAAAAGAWVPVECETKEEATRLYNSLKARARIERVRGNLGFETRASKLTIYVRAIPVVPTMKLAR